MKVRMSSLIAKKINGCAYFGSDANRMLMEEKWKCREPYYVEEVSSVMASHIQILGEPKGHGIYIEIEVGRNRMFNKVHSLILDTTYQSGIN